MMMSCPAVVVVFLPKRFKDVSCLSHALMDFRILRPSGLHKNGSFFC